MSLPWYDKLKKTREGVSDWFGNVVNSAPDGRTTGKAAATCLDPLPLQRLLGVRGEQQRGYTKGLRGSRRIYSINSLLSRRQADLFPSKEAWRWSSTVVTSVAVTGRPQDPCNFATMGGPQRRILCECGWEPLRISKEAQLSTQEEGRRVCVCACSCRFSRWVKVEAQQVLLSPSD